MSAEVVDFIKARDARQSLRKVTGGVTATVIDHACLRWVYFLAALNEDALKGTSDADPEDTTRSH